MNPHLIFEATASISKLATLGCNIDGLRDFSISFRGGSGVDGYLVETVPRSAGSSELDCKVTDFREGVELLMGAGSVFPEAKPEVLQYLLNLMKRKFDVVDLQRRYSFLDSKTSAKDRFSETLRIVEQLRKRVFPLEFDNFHVKISESPVAVRL